MKNIINTPKLQLWHSDTLNVYSLWEKPTVIISDGPYGINGYEGDAKNANQLVEMYRPHVEAWSKAADSQTTLWFWNTELGWATIHPLLVEHGWVYRNCNIWDKGIGHIAGNCNGKTMRMFPVVTEVCAHYVRKETFILESGKEISLQEWMRSEWKRTGLPMSKANEACGVKNAASRKYLANDHLWYFPPKEEFEKLINYANEFGKVEGRPYFSKDGKTPMSGNHWERVRSKFNFQYGVTNVWQYPPLRSKERLKDGTTILHYNQKPLELMARLILSSSNIGDVIWEPFGGTGSASVAALNNSRRAFIAECHNEMILLAQKRLNDILEINGS